MTGLWGVNGLFVGLFIIVHLFMFFKASESTVFMAACSILSNGNASCISRFPMTDDALRPYVVASKQRKRS